MYTNTLKTLPHVEECMCYLTRGVQHTCRGPFFSFLSSLTYLQWDLNQGFLALECFFSNIVSVNNFIQKLKLLGCRLTTPSTCTMTSGCLLVNMLSLLRMQEVEKSLRFLIMSYTQSRSPQIKHQPMHHCKFKTSMSHP